MGLSLKTQNPAWALSTTPSSLSYTHWRVLIYLGTGDCSYWFFQCFYFLNSCNIRIWEWCDATYIDPRTSSAYVSQDRGSDFLCFQHVLSNIISSAKDHYPMEMRIQILLESVNNYCSTNWLSNIHPSLYSFNTHLFKFCWISGTITVSKI